VFFTIGLTHLAIQNMIDDIHTITIFIIIFKFCCYKDNAEHPSRDFSNPTSYSAGLGAQISTRKSANLLVVVSCCQKSF